MNRFQLKTERRNYSNINLLENMQNILWKKRFVIAENLMRLERQKSIDNKSTDLTFFSPDAENK